MENQRNHILLWIGFKKLILVGITTNSYDAYAPISVVNWFQKINFGGDYHR